MKLGLPISRPTPSLHPGAHEFRLRDERGIQRVLYYTESPRSILVFHAFVKKTRKTPASDIKLGRSRLKEML